VILAAEAGSTAAFIPGAEVFIAIGIGAFLLPLLARRVGVPAVVLEILYGVLIGPSVLAVVGTEGATAGFVIVLAEIGLFLLMFLAGFEIDFGRLEREGRGPILYGLTFYAAVFAVAWIGFGFMSLDSDGERVFLTLLVSAASLGIIIPTLRSVSRTQTPQGQVTILIGVIAEFVAATGIVILAVWVRSGFGIELLGVPAFVAIVWVALVAMRRMAWWYPERAERLFSEHDPDELGIRASLALLFVFVGIALLLGIDPILGAFIAGALFASVFRNTGALETRLTGFAYGFFVPIFFISVGVRFPLEALGERSVLLSAGALILIAIAAKVLPSPALMWRGLTLRESLGSGILLAGQLSVIIALAEVGVQLELIDEGIAAGATLLVAVTAVLQQR
jgi:Kef-type K+ transport system membrane component KefB